MPRHARHALAARIKSRLDQVAAVTTVEGENYRFYLTPEHAAAIKLISGWMREAGLVVDVDAAGTLVGRKEGEARAPRTLLIGSHIASVRNTGRYDSCLGVAVAIEAMSELQRLGRNLPYSVEVIALGGADASRFPTTFVGARVLAGGLPAEALDLVDGDGIMLREALKAFGCDPAKISDCARQANDLLGFVEVHVEQGQVLEEEGAAVGVVTMISGVSRLAVEVRGKRGHAGIVPMQARRDALTGAAEMVLAIEDVGRSTAGLLATVGQFEIEPGDAGSVPDVAKFCIDVGSPVDGVRRGGVREIERRLRAIARLRRLTITSTETFDEKAVACDQRLVRHLNGAAERVGVPCIGMPSGEGHAGLAIAPVSPIGILLVRGHGGASLQQAETVKPEDVEAAIRVLLELMAGLSPNGRTLA